MARLGIIEIDQLPAMQVLETLDSDSIITERMQRFAELWRSHDPPAGAQYDVGNLEFDPIRILQEANAYFELLLRDRVNQAAKSVTLAFASGSDLDAIASRYPGGVPRLDGESDDRYRMRVWLSANTLSPHGVYESYVFWALTALPKLRDATATAQRGTANVAVTIMADGTPVTADGKSITEFPSPVPTVADINTARAYIGSQSRKALTDVVSVRSPKIMYVDYKIRYWLFPSWNQSSMDVQMWQAMATLIEKQRWLGYSHIREAVSAALMTSGVYKVTVDEPAQDVVIDQHEIVVVKSVAITFAGRGGFEEPIEP